MSLSSFCIEQREKETKQLKAFLAFSVMGSALLHGALLVLGATIPWERVLEPEAEPIEIAIVEPTPQEKPEKETQIEPPSGSPGGNSNSILTGREGGSGGTLSGGSTEGNSASTDRSESRNTPPIEQTLKTQPEPEQSLTSLPQELTSRPRSSIQSEPNPPSQSVAQPAPPPVVAL